MNKETEVWLAIALQDAEPDRRARLRAEILDHLAEARAVYEAGGMAPDAAHAAALADLGPPEQTARALRRSVRRPLAVRLAAARTRWGAPTVLALLGLLAMHTLSGPVSLPPGAEVGPVTGLALILQTAILTLALSLPLLFDDLDLSAGAVVLLGAYLLRLPDNGQPGFWNFWLSGRPEELPLALLQVGLIGAALGLLHGLLVVGLRLPAALVTLTSGIALAVALLQQPRAHHLTLGSLDRLTTLKPTLALIGAAAALLAVFAVLAAHRQGRPEAFPPAPPPLRRLLAELGLGAWLAFPLVLALAQVRLEWGSPEALLRLAAVVGVTGAGLAWAWRPEEGVRRERLRRLSRLAPVALLLSVSLGTVANGFRGAGASVGYLLQLLLLTPLAALVALALAVILRALWASRGRRWLGLSRPSREVASARIAALTLSAGLSAAVGGCIVAQGLRDGTFVHAAAFYALVPLAGLMIGGQHRLPAALRPAGVLLGALVVAGNTALGSDNLDAPAQTLVQAALFAAAWHLALPPARPLAAMKDAHVEPQLEELHRKLQLVG